MFLEFFLQNWFLFALLATIILLLVIDTKTNANGAKAVDPSDIAQLQNRAKAVIIDVSEKDVFKTGHIPTAINLPLSTLENSLNKLNKYKDKPLILVCQSENQSTKAASILSKHGITNLHFLKGGLLSWKKENLPLTQA